MLKVLVNTVSVMDDVQQSPLLRPRIKVNEIELCFESTEHLENFLKIIQSIVNVKKRADKYNRQLSPDIREDMAGAG